MELSEHLDTMAIAGLLPGKEIEEGKSWPIPNAVVLALCELDGVTEHSLQGTFEGYTNKNALAVGKIAGKASGINLGAQVEMEIDARFHFDIERKYITISNGRRATSASRARSRPASPPSDDQADAHADRGTRRAKQVRSCERARRRHAAEQPDEHSSSGCEEALRIEPSTRLARHQPEYSQQLVMRHIERGDFIAQVTITPWKQTDRRT